jgi:ATP-binding cassette subfamily B protein
LVVAHRLSTIKTADEIIVIGDEGILERGNHAKLMDEQGIYAELYNSQFVNM